MLIFLKNPVLHTCSCVRLPEKVGRCQHTNVSAAWLDWGIDQCLNSRAPKGSWGVFGVRATIRSNSAQEI